MGNGLLWCGFHLSKCLQNPLSDLHLSDSTLYFVPMLPLGQGTFQQTLPDLGCCRAGGGWDLALVYCA